MGKVRRVEGAFVSVPHRSGRRSYVAGMITRVWSDRKYSIWADGFEGLYGYNEFRLFEPHEFVKDQLRSSWALHKLGE
jgi:hypothetical protein